MGVIQGSLSIVNDREINFQQEIGLDNDKMVISIASNNPFLRHDPTKFKLKRAPQENKRFFNGVLLHEAMHGVI